MHFTHRSKKCLLGHCGGLIVKRLRDIFSTIGAVATSVLCSPNFSKKKELAFVATLTMASEIGNDGAAGDSGVPHSINISSDSPSAISDSFGRSETTAGTKNHKKFCQKIGIYYYCYAIHPYSHCLLSFFLRAFPR